MLSQLVSSLYLAGTYRRRVGASLVRIWENVLDWQHLSGLHSRNFAAVELIDSDPRGWRIRLTPQPGEPRAMQVLRLDIDKSRNCYSVLTESGPGTSSKICVSLTPHGPHDTGVVVEYHVPVVDPMRRAEIGEGFVALYEILWDEDESMMRAREAALAPPPPTPLPERVRLGPATDLALPLIFPFGPSRFRLVDLDGRLVAHSIICPHWLGPLDQAVVEAGRISCPWHGYCFDVATGRSADGQGLRLAAAPQIIVKNGIVVARRA